MFVARMGQGPERLARRDRMYVSNEVLITPVARARNDELPHYLSVASGAAAAATTYGQADIDGVLHRFGKAVRSVSRVFVPHSAVHRLASEGVTSLASKPIGADYKKRERDTDLSRTYRVSFENDVDVPHVCHELAACKSVENARANYLRTAQVTPDDEFYHLQWGLPAIQAEAGWDIETGHPDVMIAIVDSGVDLQHEDLSGKLAPGFDFVDLQGTLSSRYAPLGDYRDRDPHPDDEDGHGSHCAGIAAAESNNAQGVVGVCWGGSILPVRVMFRVYDYWKQRETSLGTDADIDAGIKFAVDAGAQVINLSLGGPNPSHETVLEYAHDQNVCVCAATGNENSQAPSYPASNPTVLAVGAVAESLNRASFSNYNPASYNQFVIAPGVHIGSSYKDNGYVYLDGTSMATPFVAGLAGLIVSLAIRAGRTLPVDDIMAVIRETATPLGTGKGDLFFSEGLINVEAALLAAKERLQC